MSDYSDAPADKMTKAYIKIRNKRAELKAAFTKEDGELAHQLDILKRALLSYCENNKVESVRTDEGLFFRSQVCCRACCT
jgi:flagellar basal body-associated protein FliL